MQKYVKNYLEYFDFKIPEDVFCEICWGLGAPKFAHDIHHIEGRGSGMDVVTNLIAVCRECHTDIHNEKHSKQKVKECHDAFMLEGGEMF